MTAKLLFACFRPRRKNPGIWPVTHLKTPESHMIIVINIVLCHVCQLKKLFFKVSLDWGKGQNADFAVTSHCKFFTGAGRH